MTACPRLGVLVIGITALTMPSILRFRDDTDHSADQREEDNRSVTRIYYRVQ